MAKRYRVIGPLRVFEHDPGEEFDRDLTEGETATLLGVHLELVEAGPKPQPEPKPVEPALGGADDPPAPKPARKRRSKPQPQSEE